MKQTSQKQEAGPGLLLLAGEENRGFLSHLFQLEGYQVISLQSEQELALPELIVDMVVVDSPTSQRELSGWLHVLREHPTTRAVPLIVFLQEGEQLPLEEGIHAVTKPFRLQKKEPLTFMQGLLSASQQAALDRARTAPPWGIMVPDSGIVLLEQ